MKCTLEQRIAELQGVLEKALALKSTAVERAATALVDTFRAGNGVFLFGNGGSAADAQHMAGELNGRYLKKRRPLKAQALVCDAAVVTSLANDYGYEQIFAKQLEANAKPGDLAFGFSTSGNSTNVVEAFKTAKRIELKTVAMTGRGGGALAELADVLIDIPSGFTPHVQEAGQLIYHCLCEQIEEVLFGSE